MCENGGFSLSGSHMLSSETCVRMVCNHRYYTFKGLATHSATIEESFYGPTSLFVIQLRVKWLFPVDTRNAF